MVKQTAAAQRRAEAEARKAAKAAAGSTAAARGHVAPDSSQAGMAAGPQASKGTAKQARAPSAAALPQAGDSSAPAAAVLSGLAGKGPKAELQTDADSGPVDPSGSADAQNSTAVAAQTNASSCDAGKPGVTAASAVLAKQGENQDMNSLASAQTAGEGEKAAAGSHTDSKAGTVKARASRKRAAEPSDEAAAGVNKKGQAARSTRGKQGILSVL